jgi:hypothetical protein
MKTDCVLCEVGTEVLCTICIKVSPQMIKQNNISDIPNRQTKATTLQKEQNNFNPL